MMTLLLTRPRVTLCDPVGVPGSWNLLKPSHDVEGSIWFGAQPRRRYLTPGEVMPHLHSRSLRSTNKTPNFDNTTLSSSLEPSIALNSPTLASATVDKVPRDSSTSADTTAPKHRHEHQPPPVHQLHHLSLPLSETATPTLFQTRDLNTQPLFCSAHLLPPPALARPPARHAPVPPPPPPQRRHSPRRGLDLRL